MIAEPPSRTEWLVDGRTFGHTPGETLAYLSWCDD